MTWESLTLRGKAKGGVQRDAVPPAFDVLRHQPQARSTAMSLAMHVREDVVSDPAMRYIDTPRLNLIGRMHAGWYTRTSDLFQMDRISRAEWQAHHDDATS
jgi:hypothetical protein